LRKEYSEKKYNNATVKEYATSSNKRWKSHGISGDAEHGINVMRGVGLL